MLIGVTGKKGSGKDEFVAELGFENVKMAGGLKTMLRSLYDYIGFDVDSIERKIEGDLKEKPCPALSNQTPRWGMQSLGTEWARGHMHPDFWTNIWRNKVSNLLLDGFPVVCTDIRFHNEAKTLRELGGRLIRVERPGLENTDTHPSETEMESLEVDETVVNDGTIAALQRKALKIVEEMSK